MEERGEAMSADRCKCGSYALNDHPDSGLCDKCWLEQQLAEKDATIAKMVESARLLCQRVDMCERGVAEYTELWGLNGDLKSKLQEIGGKK